MLVLFINHLTGSDERTWRSAVQAQQSLLWLEQASGGAKRYLHAHIACNMPGREGSGIKKIPAVLLVRSLNHLSGADERT